MTPGLHRESAGHAGGPRLVLVHGFTQTGRSWRPVAERLGRALPDHELVLVDAPGHGGSGTIDADLATAGRLLADAGGRATYVGYSMGGRMVLHTALDRPDIVERLVLLGATAGIDDPAERAERRRADDALATSIERDGVPAFLERWLANPMFAALPDDPAERAERLRNTAAGLASSLRSCGTGTQEPSWSRLAELQMPVLVLAGERDEKFAALGERLTRSIGMNAGSGTIAGAGHAAHLERPDEFVAALARFVATTEPVDPVRR